MQLLVSALNVNDVANKNSVVQQVDCLVYLYIWTHRLKKLSVTQAKCLKFDALKSALRCN